MSFRIELHTRNGAGAVFTDVRSVEYGAGAFVITALDQVEHVYPWHVISKVRVCKEKKS